MQQMIFIADLIACATSQGAREYYTDGCCLWYLVVWFSSCRYGVKLRVMCPVCGLLLHLVGIYFHIYPYTLRSYLTQIKSPCPL